MDSGERLPPDAAERTEIPRAVSTGTLFGVGMGPGEPDYLTVRAMRVLERAPVLVHFCKKGRRGNARTIADAVLAAEPGRRPAAIPVLTGTVLTIAILTRTVIATTVLAEALIPAILLGAIPPVLEPTGSATTIRGAAASAGGAATRVGAVLVATPARRPGAAPPPQPQAEHESGEHAEREHRQPPRLCEGGGQANVRHEFVGRLGELRQPRAEHVLADAAGAGDGAAARQVLRGISAVLVEPADPV